MDYADTIGKQLGAVVENLGKAFHDAFAQTDIIDLKVNGTEVSALDGDLLNATNATNATDSVLSGKKTPATLEGLITAYTGLVIMALVPIYFGSLRSVRFQKHSKVGR